MIPIALTIAASAGIGFGAHARWGAGAQAAAGGVLRTMLFGLTPMIAYLNVASIELDGRLASLVAAGWLALLGVGVVAWFAGRALRLSSPGRGALIATTTQGNTGYLGYPACVALLGSARVHSAMLVYLLVPLGFFAVGVTLASERSEGARVRPELTRDVACALGLRVVVAPLALLACTAPLGLPPRAWLLSAAMPSGINGLVVAHAYGLDLRLTSSAIAYSTAVVVAVAAVGALVA